MRLLKLDDHRGLSLTEDLHDHIPAYAILSHTWGDEIDEVNFDDLQYDSFQNKAGYGKIRFYGEQAKKDKLEYFWVGTCCINKADDSEYSYANNPVFRWYRDQSKSDQLHGPNAIYALFQTLSKRLEGCSGAFILIDALDECSPGTEREQLLDLIVKHAKSSNTRWLSSSHHDADIINCMIDETFPSLSAHIAHRRRSDVARPSGTMKLTRDNLQDYIFRNIYSFAHIPWRLPSLSINLAKKPIPPPISVLELW